MQESTRPEICIPAISIPKLPAKFAEEVLDLEGTLVTSCTLNNVKRRLELYSLAVEHYECMRNPKYIHYQERVHQLLSRKDVQRLLEVSSEAPASNSPPACQAQKNADKTLKCHYSQATSMMRKVKRNLHNQCSALTERLNNRRHRRLTRQSNTDRAQYEADTKAFENEVERVVERYVTKKHRLVRAIEDKYESDAAEVRELGDDWLVQSVMNELMKKKQQEIQAECDKLAKEKSKEIERVKATFRSH